MSILKDSYYLGSKYIAAKRVAKVSQVTTAKNILILSNALSQIALR